jgi:hypothetical protein
MGIAGMLAPALFTVSFATFMTVLPGAPFVLAALLLLVALPIAVAVTREPADVAR